MLAASAELVVGLGRAEDASPLLEELDGYSGELATVGAAVLCLGAYDRFRGMLLDLLGRHDEAVDALEAALDLERSADAATMTSRTRLWLARALRHRGAPGDLDRAKAELAEAIAAAGGLGQHGVLADARALLAEVGAESPEAGGGE